jgi:hypothetical protein
MRLFKLLVTLAGLAGVLLWSSVPVQASGCCRLDCENAYCTMVASGISQIEAAGWLAECKTNCDEHGEPDPGWCPDASCPVE